MLVGTTEMQLAAWIKEGKNGKFMSLKMSEPNSKTETTSTNDGDDMPF
jgi:hypothetical protein